MKNDKLHTILMLIATGLMVLSFFVVYFKTPATIEKIDTVFSERIEWKHDSIEIIKPIPKYIEKVRVDTVYDKDNNPIELITENKTYQDTITTCAGDTMEVTSYIKGINVTQDSLKVKLSKREIIRTETITKYITPKKNFIDHFKIGVGVGYGIGLKSKELEPFIGVSLNYNF